MGETAGSLGNRSFIAIFFSCFRQTGFEWRRSLKDHVFMIMINDHRRSSDSSYCPLCDLFADLTNSHRKVLLFWDAPYLPTFLLPATDMNLPTVFVAENWSLSGEFRGNVAEYNKRFSYFIQMIKIFSYIFHALIQSQRYWLWGKVFTPKGIQFIYYVYSGRSKDCILLIL